MWYSVRGFSGVASGFTKGRCSKTSALSRLCICRGLFRVSRVPEGSGVVITGAALPIEPYRSDAARPWDRRPEISGLVQPVAGVNQKQH